MKKANDKKNIELLICDVDNTIADFFNPWGRGFDKAVDMLSKSRGIPSEDIYNDIKLHTPKEYRYVPNIAYVINNTPILKPKTAEEKKRFLKDDARIIHTVNKMRVDGDKPYRGVVATLKKAKAGGAKIVFYSDAVFSVVLSRLTNMSLPVDLIDAIYSQKDTVVCTPPMAIVGKRQEYQQKLKAKLGNNIIMVEGWKPNPGIIKNIMNHFDITDPKRALMVGDNVRSDGGSGVGAGIDFAWAKYGTVVCDIANKANNMVTEHKGYSIGTEGHLAQINDSNRPTVVLEKSFSELTRYYTFSSKNQSKANAIYNTKKRNLVR